MNEITFQLGENFSHDVKIVARSVVPLLVAPGSEITIKTPTGAMDVMSMNFRSKEILGETECADTQNLAVIKKLLNSAFTDQKSRTTLRVLRQLTILVDGKPYDPPPEPPPKVEPVRPNKIVQGQLELEPEAALRPQQAGTDSDSNVVGSDVVATPGHSGTNSGTRVMRATGFDWTGGKVLCGKVTAFLPPEAHALRSLATSEIQTALVKTKGSTPRHVVTVSGIQQLGKLFSEVGGRLLQWSPTMK